jgi:hypothetical protein
MDDAASLFRDFGEERLLQDVRAWRKVFPQLVCVMTQQLDLSESYNLGSESHGPFWSVTIFPHSALVGDKA